MAESAASEPSTGRTVELAVSDRSGQPASRKGLREQLPGIEPERQVTDWGRSERIEGLVDRTVYEFLYHYWFRVEVQGIENVPAEGGGLLAANHAGAVPADAAMIVKAIAEEHPRPRPVHLSAGPGLMRSPGFGMFVTKVGGVNAHPANLHRLLFDERQLLLVFPEGAPAARKLIKDRYRLGQFSHGGFVEAAMRARAPIVPIAIVGAEEALPVLARLDLLRLTRLPSLSVSPAIPLPAKFKVRFLEPVATDCLGEAPWEDRSLVRRLEQEIRALIQENLLEMVAARRSVWFG